MRFKGYAACAFFPALIFNWLAPHYSGLFRYFQDEPVEFQMRFCVVAGIFAVLGHNYTCWLKFKGGKGIATSAGVYLALAPWAVLIALVVFVVALLATRYVSVGSIAAAVALPAAVWILPPHNLLLGIVTTALGVLAIYKHKATSNGLSPERKTGLAKIQERGEPNENHRARRRAPGERRWPRCCMKTAMPWRFGTSTPKRWRNSGAGAANVICRA